MTKRASLLVGILLFSVSVGLADEPLRVGEDLIKRFETRHPYVRSESGRPDVVWSQTLSYPGATYIAVHFEKFSVAPGDVVIVRSPDGRQSWKYEGLGRGQLGLTKDGFWATHIKGDRAVVELISTGGEADFGFVINRYARGYTRNEMEAQGLVMPESICGVNDALPAKCYESSEPLIYERSRAIARLLSGGSGFCTGWLVGNAGQLITNNHCISTNGGAVNTDYEFMAEGATCGTFCGPDACPGTIVDGASLVQTDATLDYSLIQLATNPTPTYGYLQLRTTGAVLNERIYIVGHPNGEGKQVVAASTDANNPSGFCELDATAATPCSGGPPDIGYFCDTEPGSSGSAVLGYEDHKVVSLHHCGGCPSGPNVGLDILDIIADLTSEGHLPPGSTFDPVGRVRLDRDAYGCSDTISIEVRDDSIIGAGSIAVAIHSSTEPTDETVTLSESPAGSGKFVGSIGTTSAGPVAGNSLLSVAHGNTILVTYIDANDGAGGTNLPRTDTATVNCVGPVITNVQITDIQGSSAMVRWSTNEPADSESDYGLTSSPPPTQTASSSNPVTTHALLIGALVPCTDYIVRVSSTDAQGNSASDDNGGLYYGFNSGPFLSAAFSASNTPLAIPTSSPTPTVATIQVPDSATVLDVNVKLNITHSWDGDMVVSLRHPDGTLVTLSNRRGLDGNNFTNTVFDDQSTTSIGAGFPPFSGSYVPDQPLSAMNGRNALGTWQLEVLDTFTGDGGTLTSAEITLTYPSQPCGPDADFESASMLADSCWSGGPGDGNGFWDDGETATFRLSIRNTGSTTLTGVTATLSSLTPGATLTEPAATYPNLPPNAVGVSQAPDFALQLAPGVACGDPINVSIEIDTNEGTFTDTFSLGVAGDVVPGSGTVLSESFAGGIPGTWTIVDGASGGGAAATWASSNPGGRAATAPITTPFAITDSDSAGGGATQDESLISPVINLSSASTVTLEFDQYFKFRSFGGAEKGDVDVRSAATGGAWVNVFRNTAESPNPNHKSLDVTLQAAGAADVQFRFRYYDASLDWYWMVDNVAVSFTGVAACNLESCAPAAPPGEVVSTWWSASTTLEWTTVPSATSYNVYRGSDVDLPKLFVPDVNSCLRGSTSSSSMTGIVGSPVSGAFDWWIVRASNGGGEGPAGSSSSGPRVHDSSGACP